MNWLDIVIMVTTFSLGLIGLWKGATKVIFGIAGLIGGIILAGKWYKIVATIISPEGAIWSGIAAYIIIVLATLIVSAILSHLLIQLIHTVMLGWLDRGIGFILGAGIGLALCIAFVAAISKIPGMEGFISQSSLATFLIGQFPLFITLQAGQLI
jgi:membrane protein required for colicin V production